MLFTRAPAADSNQSSNSATPWSNSRFVSTTEDPDDAARGDGNSRPLALHRDRASQPVTVTRPPPLNPANDAAEGNVATAMAKADSNVYISGIGVQLMSRYHRHLPQYYHGSPWGCSAGRWTLEGGSVDVQLMERWTPRLPPVPSIYSSQLIRADAAFFGGVFVAAKQAKDTSWPARPPEK